MTDEEMIKNPKMWPKYPFLPVKKPTKPGNMPDCGVIWSGELYTIRDANLFKLPPTKEEYQKLPILGQFSDVHSLLADGWIVD